MSRFLDLKNPRLSLVIACYNEIEHIQVSLPRLLRFLEFVFANDEFEVVIVDDGSHDGTREWLQQFHHRSVTVHFNAKNMGRGGAVKAGLKLSRGQALGFLDIDLEVSEAYIPVFVQAIESGCDVVIAHRIYKVSSNPYIVLRHFLSVAYRAVLRHLIRCHVRDTEAGYKFFSRRFINHFLNQSRFDDWFCDTEIALLAEYSKFKIGEIPTLFLRNEQKTSTVHILRDSFRYARSIATYLRFMKNGVYTRADFGGSSVRDESQRGVPSRSA
jgi:glycosyltransferase involved in cell wall biosynthesis